MKFYLFLIANPVSRTIVLATSPHPELPQVLTFYALTIAVDLEVDVEIEVVHDALFHNLQIPWGHLPDGHIYTGNWENNITGISWQAIRGSRRVIISQTFTFQNCDYFLSFRNTHFDCPLPSK